MTRRNLPQQPASSESISRRLLRLAGATSLLALVGGENAFPRAGKRYAQRPNIIYMHSHDTGRYIQPYGHNVSTPHLQRFADEGIVFRRLAPHRPARPREPRS